MWTAASLAVAYAAMLAAYGWWALVRIEAGAAAWPFISGVPLVFLAFPLLLVRAHGRRHSDRASRVAHLVLGVTWVFFAWSVLAHVLRLVLAVAGVENPVRARFVAIALLVVGLLYLAGGALWNHVPQYVVGVWVLISAVVSVLVGYPANFLVLALLGGGFIVLGLWMHLRAGDGAPQSSTRSEHR